MLRQPPGGLLNLDLPPLIHVLFDPLCTFGGAHSQKPRQPRDEIVQQAAGFGLDWIGGRVTHTKSTRGFSGWIAL
jgi:hypothetical protein